MNLIQFFKVKFIELKEDNKKTKKIELKEINYQSEKELIK